MSVTSINHACWINHDATSQFPLTENKDNIFFIIQSKPRHHPITLVREGGAAISLTTILI